MTTNYPKQKFSGSVSYLICIQETLEMPHTHGLQQGIGLTKSAISHTPGGHTLLTAEIADQAALHGLLARLRDLNLTLIFLQRFEPPQRS